MWLELPVRLSRTYPPNAEGEPPRSEDLGMHPALINANAVTAIVPNAPANDETMLFVGGNQLMVMEPYDKVRRLLVRAVMQTSIPNAE